MVEEGERQGCMLVSCKQGKPMRLSASLATASPAGGREAKGSYPRPAWVSGMVGQGEAVVAKVGVGFSFSLRFSLCFPLMQPADMLEGGTTTRVSLVQPVA